MHLHFKTKIIWFGVGKCYQDHWKKIPILVYIILDGLMPSDAGYKGRLYCWPQDAVSLTLATLICTTLLACAELSANTMLRWRKWASSPSILECQLSCLVPARILFDLRPVSSEQSTVLRELCILACAGAKMGSSTSTQTHKHFWYHVISK